MSVAMDKAKISGLVGILGAVSAAVSGFAGFFIITGFTTFFLMMLIQYGSIKFKVATSLATLLGLSYVFSNPEEIPFVLNF